MNGPTRLVDEAPDGFAASLIRAARNDAPSAPVRRAAAAAGGAAVATLLAPSASAAGTTLKAILGAGVKGFLVGAVVTATAVGASSLVSLRPARTAPPAPAARSGGERVPSVAGARAAPAPEAMAGTAVTPAVDPGTGARVVVRGRSAPAQRSEPPPGASEPATRIVGSSGALGEELRAFEPAQRAFAAGDVMTAGRELEGYQRRFPQGALSLEAQVLRLEILEARGDRAAAQAGAQAFLAANPLAPASRRVRSLLARLGARTQR